MCELIQKRDGILYSRCPGSHKKNAERKRIIINVIRKLNIQHRTQSPKYNQCMVNIVEAHKSFNKIEREKVFFCVYVCSYKWKRYKHQVMTIQKAFTHNDNFFFKR